MILDRRMGRLDGLSGFRLAASIGPLLLCLVVRMGLLVVVAAFAAKKVEDFLSVGTAHVPSFRIWRAIVKRTTVIGHG